MNASRLSRGFVLPYTSFVPNLTLRRWPSKQWLSEKVNE